METIDVMDIQGLIVRGYSRLFAAQFLMLRFGDALRARSWLGSVVNAITPGRPDPTETAVNLAFTYSGIEVLGLPPRNSGADFSHEFISGMVAEHRSRALGDVGDCAPSEWDWGGPNHTVNAVLMLFAPDAPTLAQLADEYGRTMGEHDITFVRTLDTSDLDGREHFGFHDGISQPIIEGLSSRAGPAHNTIKPGEFLLGHLNEYGLLTERPTLPVASDTRSLLLRTPDGSADFGRNGSYLVLRTLSQDVAAFRSFLEEASKDFDGDKAAAREWLSAKMVGRWPSGAPLIELPDRDDPSRADSNDFLYHKEDPTGLRCPIGAHIRRSNPRDSLDPKPGSANSIAIGKRHRILRRGREYGPPFDPADEASGKIDRGLHFLCFNANIARQFEFIQSTWINNPKFAGQYDDEDPLLGPRQRQATDESNDSAVVKCPLSGTFTIPGRPIRRRIAGLSRFVRVRGGAYFFMPGIRALRYLASI